MKIRRVIVGLDPAVQSRALLEAAVGLAGRMEAELVGLFVEDQNLLHFAGLPFAREVGFASATRRTLDVESMERSLRALAQEARRTLASIAGQTSVRWSFRVVRGSVGTELLAALEEADLAIAKIGRLEEASRPASVRVVRAGDIEELRAALNEEGGGVLLLGGSDDILVCETLRQLPEG